MRPSSRRKTVFTPTVPSTKVASTSSGMPSGNAVPSSATNARSPLSDQRLTETCANRFPQRLVTRAPPPKSNAVVRRPRASKLSRAAGKPTPAPPKRSMPTRSRLTAVAGCGADCGSCAAALDARSVANSSAAACFMVSRPSARKAESTKSAPGIDEAGAALVCARVDGTGKALDRLLDGGGIANALRIEQRRNAGDVRSRHRRSLERHGDEAIELRAEPSIQQEQLFEEGRRERQR